MENCTDCKHSEWAKTGAGRLHPSGDGRCKYPWKIPALPAPMYWLGSAPSPLGGQINRREEMKEHCTYFARKEMIAMTDKIQTAFEKWADDKFGADFINEETITYFRMSAAFDAGAEAMREKAMAEIDNSYTPMQALMAVRAIKLEDL